MKKFSSLPRLVLLLAWLLTAANAAQAQALAITGLSPARNMRHAPRTNSVFVSFSQTMQNTAATRGAVRVYSQQRGGQLRDGARGTATVSGGTITLDPTNDFKPGETLFVTTTREATATNGSALAVGRVHQFTAATDGSGRGIFAGGASLAVGYDPRSVAVGDVDGDGDLDLLAVNNNNGNPGTVSVRLNGGNNSGSNTGTFANGSEVPVGSSPHSVVLGDVDGDGDLDLLTANYGSGTVSVRLNGGNNSGSNTGTFANGSEVPVGSLPRCLAVGDVDGDGDLDLFATTIINSSVGSLNVRLNGGDATGSNTGTFGNGSDVDVGADPRSIVVGDVDGDGDLDALTASSGTVSVRQNLSNISFPGVFANGTDVAVGGTPSDIVLGDVDGDGDLDLLATRSSSGTVAVRLNGGNNSGSGSGVFSNGSDPAVGNSPESVAVGDVDGDGDLDLLTTNYSYPNGTVSVRLNGGDAMGSSTGTFSNGSTVPVGGYATCVTLGDVDGDGDLDLLAANSNSNTVTVRLNQPPLPTISGFTPGSGLAGTGVTVTGTGLTGATAVTLNGAAITGFTVVNSTTITFTVPAGSTSGPIAVTTPSGTATSSGSFTFIPPPAISGFTPGSGPVGTGVTVTGTGLTGATAVTLNGAAITGFTVVNSTTITFTVPTGSTSGPIGITTPGGTATSSGSFSVIPAPVISGFSPTSGTVGTSVTVSGSNFTGASSVTVNGTAGTITGTPTASSLTFTVGAGTTTGTIRVTTPGGTATSSGSFSVVLITALSPTRNLRNAPRAANVAVTFSEPMQNTAATRGAVRVHSQQRGGQLRDGAQGTTTVSGNTITFNPTTDFRPGETLLVTTTTAATTNSGGTLARGHVHQFTAATGGTGRGTFGVGSDLGVGRNPSSVVVGDVDGDGDLDLLTANSGSSPGTVSVRLNGGNSSGSNTGTFSGGSDTGVGGPPSSVALGDMDGDGDLDLLTTNSGSNTVSVRLNGGDNSGSNTGTFSGGSDTGVGGRPRSVALGDMDGDGDLDLLTANASSSSNTVSVRLNGGDNSGSNTGTFSGGSDPAVASSPFSVVVGDVDGDGDLDLLTANASSNTVSVRLNGGNSSGSNTGTFSGGSDLYVGGGSNPYSVAVGDVDGDGDLDVLTANFDFGTVSVRLNGGNSSGSNTGTFSGGSDTGVGGPPRSVALGDMDGDGDLDLLTTNSGSNTVSVRLNGGDNSGSNTGTFSGGTDTGVGDYPISVAVGDVDGDGDLDLLTANFFGVNASVRLNQPAPTISGFTPTTGPIGQSVTVTGTDLNNASSVTVNGTAGTITGTPTASSLTFTVGAGSMTGTISVTTPGGTATSSGSFLVIPAPTITSFTPTTGPIGQSVTVSGTDLTGAISVTVNGTAGTITGTPTASSLTFTVGAGSTTGPISLTTPGGTATSTGDFTVIPAPTISGFSPTSGPIGQTVTVSGSNFTGATALTVGGTGVAFTFVNSTTLTFVVPANGPSGVVAVTTPGGTGTSSGSFTFLPPPTITSVAPTSANTGSTITITGTNLGGTTGVTLNGVAITGFTVVNGTTITFTLPAGATSGPTGLTAPGGTVSGSATPLTVDNTPPTATVSTTATSPVRSAPIPFTVTFSEPVTGLAAAGLSVTGGTVTPGSLAGSGTTYTFTLTPTSSGPAAVPVTARVNAGAAQDAATNPSLASNTVSINYLPPPDLTNTGTLLTVQAGGILYVGTTGLSNLSGTLTNAGTLHVAGTLTNPAAGTLALGAGTLEVKGDLTNAGTVTPGTSAVTFSGTSDQLLTPGGATLYQVVVNKPTAGANTLRLAGDLTISNSLTLTSGNVNTKSGTTVNTLRLPQGATLSGEATGRYVRGAVEVTRNAVSGAAVDFGHGAVLDPRTSNLGTVRITRTAGLLTDEVSRGVNPAGPTLKGIDRIWSVTAATQPTAAVQLRLSWLPDDDNGLTNFVQARGWHQAAPGQPWLPEGPVTNAAGRFLTLNPTSFSRFTVSNDANPLPVTLLAFTAQAEGPAAARLRWATAQELNNIGFTVERSPDGQTFQDLGTVAGAGTTASPTNYTYLDPLTLLPTYPHTLYYRLRQADRDGTVSYSPVRAVHFTSSPHHLITLFPNPARDGEATLTGAVPGAPVTVLDALGRVIVAAPADASGTAALRLPAGLAAGVYVVRTGAHALRLTVE